MFHRAENLRLILLLALSVVGAATWSDIELYMCVN